MNLKDLFQKYKPIKLPYKSRNVKRLVKVLKPKVIKINRENLFVWNIEKLNVRYLCLVKGSEYKVVFRRVRTKDFLSGLYTKISVPLAFIDDNIIWKAVWNGSLYVVNDVFCYIIVKDDVILCNGTKHKNLAECL